MRVRGTYPIIAILLLAVFLRIYRIETLTEFLGDQGRTMLHMRDFVEGNIPLVGPTTLSGHHLGPMFYYLLAPGYILFGASPVGVAIWMGVLGTLSVFVLYETVRHMFGKLSAIVVSFLWAVSPAIVPADRAMWEPNLVPLFSLLFIYLLYRAHRERLYWLWIALGAVVGVLVQLHYPTVFFIGLTGLYVLVTRNVRAIGWLLLGFIVPLVPFLWYEATVGFRDIQGIASVMISGGGAFVGKRMMVNLWFGYAFRVFGRALPFMSRWTVAVLLSLWLIFVAKRPSKKNMFLTVWFIAGLTPMARFSWVVYDHYLYFLLPVPFLMIGSVLSTVKKPAIFLAAIIVLFQLMNTDIFRPGNNDIERVRTAVERIQKEVGSSRFSFTLINSKSFSDLHYRYFMKRISLTPEPILEYYDKLILVCDETDCPAPKALMKEKEIHVMCYDEQCLGLYPKIQLFDQWRLVKIVEGRIFVFERRPKEYLVQ